VKAGETLPEVILLRDARGERPTTAVGIGAFWYEPEVWDLPLSPAAKVLYAGLCSFLGHGQINRRDLRATLGDRGDGEIAAALEELVRHRLLKQSTGGASPGYAVWPVSGYEG
jgi:hypothetical protein